jgi:hypothetical protein
MVIMNHQRQVQLVVLVEVLISLCVLISDVSAREQFAHVTPCRSMILELPGADLSSNLAT